jgi:hypothetical protein
VSVHASGGTVVARTVHPLSSLRIGQGYHRYLQTVARLRRWWVRLRGTSPPHASGAAGLCHDTIADRMIPPGAWAAAPPSRPPALIRRAGRCGIRLTRKPPGLHVLDVRRDDCGFLRLGGGIGLGLLLRQLVRMHHHKAERCERYSAVTVLNLHLLVHALPMPTAWRLVLRPSRFLH